MALHHTAHPAASVLLGLHLAIIAAFMWGLLQLAHLQLEDSDRLQRYFVGKAVFLGFRSCSRCLPSCPMSLSSVHFFESDAFDASTILVLLSFDQH